MAETLSLALHPAGHHNYVGIVNLGADMDALVENQHRPLRCIILDNSGSMGQETSRMLHKVFPKMLEEMGAEASEDLLLILFSSSASTHWLKVGDLPSFRPPSQGATNMREVFRHLQAAIKPETTCLQILALSDGQVHDQGPTAANAAAVAAEMKDTYKIEARAVRLQTSCHGSPDTTALASVLQFNTDSAADLLDVNASGARLGGNRGSGESQGGDNMAMATAMAQMFSSMLSESFVMQNTAATMCLQPWDAPKDSLRLRRGRSAIWFDHRPENLRVDGKSVTIVDAEPLTQSSMETILSDRLDFFVNQIKVLKVIDTEAAKEQIERIVSFFRSFEASLQPDAEMAPLLDKSDLKSRSLYLKKSVKSRLRSVTTLMENIANDDRVRSLNEAQKADYLRQMGTNKNARALAKRAQTSGMDFDTTLRREIQAMRRHLSELEEVCTRDHAVSFYSQATTMEGIEAVCQVAEDEDLFQSMLAVDLLRLFNVVGVPAVGPVADYPDPMTYRLDRLIAGNYVSVADLSIVELRGSSLKVPGTNTKIINAVPYFEELKIQRFLMQHAPTALEYMCSIGMRRVLAEVPLTFPYTMCAGVWRLIQQLDTEKSELNIKLLQRLAPAYHESCKKRFDYVVDLCIKDSDPEKSYFLSYNGATNMIAPLWALAETGKLDNMPRILRALYSFETFQVMRRFCRQKDAKYYQDQLDRLLGVNFEERGTALPEMFTRKEPEHTQSVVLNAEHFQELREAIHHVKYISIIVPLFLAMRSGDVVEAARAIPEISDETLSKALGLDYPLDEFLLYNMVEGFLFQTKQSRSDKETTKSLRPDLGVRVEGEKMVREYLLERYSADYDYRLKQMAGEEKKVLMDEHIAALVASEEAAAFSRLLSSGTTRGDISFQIANFNSQGCLELHAALMDKKLSVAKRAEKLYVFYTGEDLNDPEKAVWNGGNGYRTSTKPLQQLLESLEETAMWERIRKRYETKISHVYRSGACNRHGHSNDLPSYFAYGHDILLSFVCISTEEVWLEYQKLHPNCCGIQEALADPAGLTEAIKRWNAKRERRTKCENDRGLMNAAIDRKKAVQAQRRSNPKPKFQARPRVQHAEDSDSDHSQYSGQSSQASY
eukprot:TRINITY_DN12314_c0_g1_i2.p1 TRINITY_DN12314_c0_g1~~TRINITY_DN12314_c0_g1_i2.p1  ORF type:complete len:1116 (-),score=288.73 TRINITY_DN12314_c0_g1_i2:433-3780(-)